MRVAYFTESLHPHVDGVSHTLGRLFSTLEVESVEFAIFSPFVPGPEVSWGTRVRALPYVRFPLYPQYRVSLPLKRGLQRQILEFNPDLIHVVSPTPTGYFARRLAHSFDRPVVASFHTHFVSYFRYYGVRSLESIGWSLLRSFYRGFARIYAPSQSMLEELQARGIRQLDLWSRGIDTTAFSPHFRDPDLFRPATGLDRVPVVLLVSRLVREKDLADLSTIYRILRDRGVQFQMVIVGDGPMRQELEAALPEATFTGHRTGVDLARHYASADAFVFPSTTETFGNVVLEALASGLPAVVSDRGGPRDLIDSGRNGIIASANDPMAFADALEPILRDPALRQRMSIAARESAEGRDWDAVNRGLIESYAQIIATNRTRSSRR